MQGDTFKNDFFRDIGLPLLRFPAAIPVDREEVLRRIEEVTRPPRPTP